MSNVPYNPAANVPQAEGAYTWITRKGNGQITQLDTYIPEAPAGEECYGIDFKVLLEKYPDIRIARVNIFADKNEGDVTSVSGNREALFVPAVQVYPGSGVHPPNSDVLTTKRATVLSPDFFAPIDTGVTINQRFGIVHAGALAVAVLLPS